MSEHAHERMREFRHGAILVVLAVVLTAAFHNTFLVRDLERVNLDSFYSLSGEQSSPDIEIVAITEDDYPNFTGAHGALDREKVMDVIRGISEAGAAIVAIDILTPDWPTDTEQQIGTSTPLVWVRGIHDAGPHGATLDPVLGGDGRGICQGPAALREIGGMAREYTKHVAVTGDGVVPSFTRVVERIHESPGSAALCTEDSEANEFEPIGYMGKAGTFRHVSAGTVLAARKTPDWASRKLMAGKIVLLGGTFAASRDDYKTPVQDRMYGVEVLANIIASDVSHKWIDEAGWWLFLVVDALVGLALVTIGLWVQDLRALFVMLLAVLVIALGSVFLFQYFRFYLSFMPVVAGVTIHFLLEQWQRCGHMRSENIRLTHENKLLNERARELGRRLEKQP